MCCNAGLHQAHKCYGRMLRLVWYVNYFKSYETLYGTHIMSALCLQGETLGRNVPQHSDYWFPCIVTFTLF